MRCTTGDPDVVSAGRIETGDMRYEGNVVKEGLYTIIFLLMGAKEAGGNNRTSGPLLLGTSGSNEDQGKELIFSRRREMRRENTFRDTMTDKE